MCAPMLECGSSEYLVGWRRHHTSRNTSQLHNRSARCVQWCMASMFHTAPTGAFCIHCRPVIDQQKHVDRSHLTLLNLSIEHRYDLCRFLISCLHYRTGTEPCMPPDKIHYRNQIDFAEYFSRKNQIIEFVVWTLTAVRRTSHAACFVRYNMKYKQIERIRSFRTFVYWLGKWFRP